VPDLLRYQGGSFRDQVKSYVRARLVETYAENEVALASNLTCAPSVPALLWLTWSRDRVLSRETEGLPFDRWDEFATTIVKAASINRRVMLPQIAWLITIESLESPEIGGSRYKFDETRAVRLFGSVKTVRDLFGNESPADWKNEPRVSAVLSSLPSAPAVPQAG
jgi:hypothetical protein